MVNRIKSFRSTYCYITIIFLVIVGGNGTHILQAMQLDCEPDCPMHQETVRLPACCQETPHTQMDMAAAATKTAPPISSDCCQGKSCLDSSDEQHRFIILNAGSSDRAGALPATAFSVATLASLPLKSTVPPDSIPQSAPHYKLTCVYLI